MNIDPSAPVDRPETAQMLVIHRALRREVVLLQRLVAADRDARAGRRASVVRHAGLVLDFLHGHHDSEDRLIRPLLHARVPVDDDLVAAMEHEHETVDVRLRRARTALAGWEALGGAVAGAEAAHSLAQLHDALEAHLDHEERDVLPLVHAHLTVPEWQAAEDDALVNGPPALRDKLRLVGMVLEEASPAERAWFLSVMPPAARLLWALSGQRAYSRYTASVRRDLRPAPSAR